MYSTTYQIPRFGNFMTHFPGLTTLVRDTDELDDTDELLVRARIRSGDYFVTLATELDKMAQGLVAASAPEAPELERVVGELLYLQRYFELRPKPRR